MLTTWQAILGPWADLLIESVAETFEAMNWSPKPSKATESMRT